MKKLLALIFVCAGLTAMAAVPQVNKADLSKANKGEMLMKSNTLANHLTASVSPEFMAAAKKNVVKNHSANLVNKRASRSIMSDQELVSIPHVCFLYKCNYNEDYTGYVEADPFFAGGGAYWYPNLSQGLYFAGFYWDQNGSTYYLPLDVDYETGEVALSWGILLEDTTITGQGGRTRTDTILYSVLCSEAFYLNDEQTDCMGTLYEDGSIIFDDNYVYFGYTILKNYRNGSLLSSDTTYFEDVFVGTEILAANGELSYTKEQDGSAKTCDVYMFQENDSLFVGNMYDYGVPNLVMTIDPDAKMHVNCTIEEDGQIYLYNPIWDVDDNMIAGGLGEFFPVGELIEDEEGIDVVWGFEGDATPDQITWDYATACNGYHILYGWLNNVLKWTNGGKFVIPTAPGPDFIRGDVDDDEVVNISDVTALIDALLQGDFDIINADAADCDEDGSISISDVTALIDYLLSGHW